eukprot:776533-Pelagomonas_calceolata.AAC.6
MEARRAHGWPACGKGLCNAFVKPIDSPTLDVPNSIHGRHGGLMAGLRVARDLAGTMQRFL